MKPEVSKLKRNPKMIISALAVTLVLCIAPIGSYLFLKSGFQYRLESLNQLTPKELDADLKKYIAENAPFMGNARLIYLPGNEEAKELKVLHDIDHQIVDRSRFDIVSFGKNDSSEKNKIDFRFAEPISNPYQFILMDTSNVVRGVYEYEENIGKEIIRHLSVVIPMQRSRSITLNRNKE